jgi:predicted secreted protein
MGLWAFGTAFKRGDGADPEVFTEIAGITGITPPDFSRDTQNANLLNGEDGWERVVATIKRSGEIQLNLEFDPAGESEASLLTDFESGETKNYQIVFPDDTTWQLPAVVTGFQVGELTAENLMTATVRLKVNGKPNLNVA